MPFISGESYTRKKISSVLGGGVQDYLPHIGGSVVCACLKQSMNPGIPDTVLVGRGVNVEKYARAFAEQENYIPTFIKRAVNDWVYVGNYRVKELSENPHDIKRLAREAGRSDVVMILRLEREI